MTQGTPSNFWIAISQGILSSALSPFAPFFKHINFLYIFEGGLLFDELALLLGSVLLASRCYKSLAATVFVSMSTAYTSISSTQPWFDFHLFYLLPLILYCLDRAVRDESVWHLFLAALFAAATLLGNLPYFAPVTAFVILAFWLAVYLFDPDGTRGSLRRFLLQFSWRHVLAIIVPTCMAFGVILSIQEGLSYSNISNLGRGVHGQVGSAVEFITYGGYVGFGKYVELIGRYSNNLDNSIYGGLLIVPFALVTLLCVRTRLAYAFGAVALVLASFSAGSLVSLAFYYAFPFGKVFRHIGLIASLVKVFLVFYAGFGFEAYWMVVRNSINISWSNRPSRDRLALLIPAATVLIIFVLFSAQRLLGFPIFRFPPWGALTENQLYLSGREISMAMTRMGLLTGGVVVLLSIIVRWPRWSVFFASLLLLVHGLDALWLKTELEYGRVPQVSTAVMNLFTPYDYEFPKQRTQEYYSNSRFVTLAPFILGSGGLPGRGHMAISNVGRYGALYWTLGTFLFLDSVASPFRTDFWLDSVDAFYRAWIPPSQSLVQHLGFPFPDSPSYRKLSGLGFPKLQAFSRIHILRSDAAVANVLGAHGFRGDMILASSRDMVGGRDGGQDIVNRSDSLSAYDNDRIFKSRISVGKFTFDTLELSVQNPLGEAAVLYYADAWHPDWHAFVNGAESRVWRTNLAYKSVVIPPGRSRVVFKFGDWRNKDLLASTTALGMLVLGAILSLLVVDLRAGRRLSLKSMREITDRSGPEGTRSEHSRTGVRSWRSRSLRPDRMGKRFAILFGIIYPLWAVLSPRFLAPGVWSVARLIDPAGLLLIQAGVTTLAGVISLMLAYLTKDVDHLQLVPRAVVIGLIFDLIGFVVFGLNSVAPRVSLFVHILVLASAGLISNKHLVFRVAYLGGILVVMFASLGMPLNLCYIPGRTVRMSYDPTREVYVAQVHNTDGIESYPVPSSCVKREMP